MVSNEMEELRHIMSKERPLLGQVIYAYAEMGGMVIEDWGGNNPRSFASRIRQARGKDYDYTYSGDIADLYDPNCPTFIDTKRNRAFVQDLGTALGLVGDVHSDFTAYALGETLDIPHLMSDLKERWAEHAGKRNFDPTPPTTSTPTTSTIAVADGSEISAVRRDARPYAEMLENSHADHRLSGRPGTLPEGEQPIWTQKAGVAGKPAQSSSATQPDPKIVITRS